MCARARTLHLSLLAFRLVLRVALASVPCGSTGVASPSAAPCLVLAGFLQTVPAFSVVGNSHQQPLQCCFPFFSLLKTTPELISSPTSLSLCDLYVFITRICSCTCTQDMGGGQRTSWRQLSPHPPCGSWGSNSDHRS